MKRLLENWDVSSLYPNIVRLFGYSSRNQESPDDYIKLLEMRINAKHGKLSDNFLKPLGLTNEDLKIGLKLPINAYTGGLRAKFNPLYDNLQGFSICTTGQLLMLQLMYDLKKIPTLEIISCNTDAIMYEIDENYKEDVRAVLHDWENHTGLELEEDKIIKIIMRDVNNYAEIVQVGDNDYQVHYKGGEFRGKHIFTWDKENKIFHYTFKDDLKANSLTIISEALLKDLLFDIPLEETINNCNDIFRFQMITHLGSTYERCVQESDNGDIELQRNNRVYAGKVPRGTIIKIKSNGRRDSLANCPPNPIVDNANELTIDDINKAWYIKLARQKLNDFKGIKRLSDYKKDELVALAVNKGVEIDKKIKKEDLIKLLEESEEVVMATKKAEVDTTSLNIYQKVNEIKKEIRKHDFTLDEVMPGNLGAKEYASIGQYYDILHTLCEKYNVLFTWEVCDLLDFKEGLFRPTGKMPSHVATVKCIGSFIDCDNPTQEKIIYISMASGSDICDKAVSGASTLAFRNFFDKNFTPKYMNNAEEVAVNDEATSEPPKVPVYIPEEKKEEIKKEVVATPQKEDSDDEDIKRIVNNIMKVRELTNKEDWGANTLQALMNGNVTSADILEIDLKVNTKLESLGE